jgi:hypothetical protein
MLPNFFRNVSHVAECTIKKEERGKFTIEYTTHIFHPGLGKSNITTERMGEPFVRERLQNDVAFIWPQDFEECSPGVNSYYCEFVFFFCCKLHGKFLILTDAGLKFELAIWGRVNFSLSLSLSLSPRSIYEVQKLAY